MRDAAAWDRLAAEKGPDRAAWDEDTPYDQTGRIAALIDAVPSGWVVDIGCGPGRTLTPLAVRYPHRQFIGVDVSSKMVAPLRSRQLPYVVVCLTGSSRISLYSGEAAVVYSMLTFQHVTDWTVRQYIKETARVLVDGGHFVFQFVVGDGQAGPLAYGRSPEQMIEWCETAGLTATAEPDEHRPTWAWITGQKGHA